MLDSPVIDRNALGLGRLAAGARIVVAMSGGVDSSTTAALLKAEGYDVIGVTLQLYDYGAARRRPGACCAGEDIKDARRVAETIGISHYVLDYESRFKKAVIDDFADSYVRGETPIPCVRCNQKIKFADLMDVARELGADAPATGHYVRREEGRYGAELHKATDETRDQSYFLFATTRAQLDFLRFPLGALEKRRTRAIAEAFNLSTSDKPDSQDICFVPEGRYANVIERLRPGAAEPGEIVDIEGRVVGTHSGIVHFTIGQRRGLGLPVSEPDGKPLFVIKLDAAQRRVVVGPRSALAVKRIAVGEVNWLANVPLESVGEAGQPVLAKVRSTRAPVAGLLVPREAGSAEVILDGSEESVAPGQACVFYDTAGAGTRVLGGGFIRSAR